MIYECPKCGKSKSNEIMGSVLPQCICDWQTPMTKRTWQGLTDEEYSLLHDGLYQSGKSLGWVVDQIESILKAKNT